MNKMECLSKDSPNGSYLALYKAQILYSQQNHVNTILTLKEDKLLKLHQNWLIPRCPLNRGSTTVGTIILVTTEWAHMEEIKLFHICEEDTYAKPCKTIVIVHLKEKLQI